MNTPLKSSASALRYDSMKLLSLLLYGHSDYQMLIGGGLSPVSGLLSHVCSFHTCAVALRPSVEMPPIATPLSKHEARAWECCVCVSCSALTGLGHNECLTLLLPLSCHLYNGEILSP